MADDVPHMLQTARSCVDRLARDHGAVTAGMASYMTAAMHAGLDAQGAVEWTAVESAAMRRIASRVGDYQGAIERALSNLLSADLIRGLVVTSVVDTAKAAAELRCDGYDNPTCERTGVQDVWISGHNHWLCQRCWQNYRKAKQREGVTS